VEIATARADAGCRARTNVVGVWRAVETAHQRIAVDVFRPELERITEANRVRLTNAARVV
jgi:hypothetical protein